MWIIGLTGGMGAGKSTLAKAFQTQGVFVHSSDEEIHALFDADKEVQNQIRALWPDVFHKGKIDRARLRTRALSSPHGLAYLEDLLYPKLVQSQKRFLQRVQRLKTPVVVLDVPLLFETGLDRYCHLVVVSSAPFFLRQKRVLGRKGMTRDHFLSLDEKHMCDHEKEKWADIIIPSGREKGSALKMVQQILKDLSKKSSPLWTGRWPNQLKREPYDKRNRLRYGNNWI